MGRKVSPAERARRVTAMLLRHLQDVQVGYLRAAALLAEVRDDRLHAALGHRTLEAYAARRLGLGRTSLRRLLQLHDWALAAHPAWLAPKPAGFVPRLDDAYALMWLERRLADERLDAATRAKLRRLRRKALGGSLTLAEFEAACGPTAPGGTEPPLRSLLSALRSTRRRAARVPGLPAEVVADLDRLVARVEREIDGAAQVVSLAALFAARVRDGRRAATRAEAR